jgi:hypothetical protein
VTLSFESDRVSAAGGCNTFTGAASWDDGTQEQDDWFTGFLASSPDLALDGPR